MRGFIPYPKMRQISSCKIFTTNWY